MSSGGHSCTTFCCLSPIPLQLSALVLCSNSASKMADEDVSSYIFSQFTAHCTSWSCCWCWAYKGAIAVVEAQVSVQLAFSCQDVDVKWLGQTCFWWYGGAFPHFYPKCVGSNQLCVCVLPGMQWNEFLSHVVLLRVASLLREWDRVLDQPEDEMAIGLLPQFLLPPSCRRDKCCGMPMGGSFLR